MEKLQIRFSLYDQAAVRKDYEEESEEQIEEESEHIELQNDPSDEHEQLAPEELLRVLPGDLEKAECSGRAEQSWRNYTSLC